MKRLNGRIIIRNTLYFILLITMFVVLFVEISKAII